jgi:hypothetical protein
MQHQSIVSCLIPGQPAVAAINQVSAYLSLPSAASISASVESAVSSR